MSLKFSIFDKHPELIYGFSEKSDGSLRLGDDKKMFKTNLKRRIKYFSKLGISINQITQANLVHGNRIFEITRQETGRIIPDTDGL